MHFHFLISKNVYPKANIDTCMVNYCEKVVEECDSELYNDTYLKSLRNTMKIPHVE
jgi:hypothetical protein